MDCENCGKLPDDGASHVPPRKSKLGCFIFALLAVAVSLVPVFLLVRHIDFRRHHDYDFWGPGTAVSARQLREQPLEHYLSIVDITGTVERIEPHAAGEMVHGHFFGSEGFVLWLTNAGDLVVFTFDPRRQHMELVPGSMVYFRGISRGLWDVDGELVPHVLALYWDFLDGTY